MKAVILAGGLGTRISEETSVKPKPMVEIGGLPILVHIMKHYFYYGVDEFIICCGYKGYYIKEYFSNYFLHNSDVTIDMKNNDLLIHHKRSEPWKVTLIDTGETTMTGGRLKMVGEYIKDEDFFFFTYGDGLSDINIAKQIDFHKKHGKMATISAVSPPGRFGAMEITDNSVTGFLEKPKGDGGLINGGYFILSPEVLKYINDDSTVWEEEPMKMLVKDKQIMSYIHNGFWQPMDTLRDKIKLEEIWNSGNVPWRKI
jgi:glucose-1-phosphate cytidylyltransferase